MRNPLVHVIALMAASAGLHAAVVARSSVPARDAIGHMRLARDLAEPPEGHTRRGVLRASMQPPGYALLILAVAGDRDDPDAMTLAAQVAAALAGVLLVIPTYLLGRSLYSHRAGWRGAALFQILPVSLAVSSDGLADSAYLLFAATSAWLAASALRSPAAWRWPLCGTAGGLAYLVRPEGVLIPLAAAVASRRFGPAALLLIGTAAAAGPYIAAVGKFTNKPGAAAVVERLLGGDAGPTWEQACRPRLAVIAAYRDPAADDGRLAWAARAVLAEAGQASHYGPGFLILAGLAVTARRWRRDPPAGFVVALIAINVSQLVATAGILGYVSERHTLPAVMFGCVFAAAGLPSMARWVAGWALWRRGDGVVWLRLILLLTAVCCLAPALGKRLHANRDGHRRAGEWLRRNVRSGDAIWDPFHWSEFYAGRWRTGVAGEPSPGGAVFVVVEEEGRGGIADHQRLPMYPQAAVMAGHGREVFRRPSHRAGGEKHVVVYLVGR